MNKFDNRSPATSPYNNSFIVETKTISNDGAMWIGRTDADADENNARLLRLWPMIMAWGLAT